MRLIDAETRITALIYQCENEEGELEWHTKSMTIEEFLNEYAEQGCPKLKTGKWIEKNRVYSEESHIEDWQSCCCSVCGHYDTRPYMYYFNEPNYCSYCGARMVDDETD